MIRRRTKNASVAVTAAFLWPLAALIFGRDVMAQEQYLVFNIVPGEDYRPVFEDIQKITKRRSAEHIVIQPKERTVHE